MTQVTFWTAYQDFVAPDPDPNGIKIPGPTVAGEVIKAATTAFSGASAMVMREDREGRPLPQQKFVINGLRFKRSLGESSLIQYMIPCAYPLHRSSMELHVQMARMSRKDGSAIECRIAGAYQDVSSRRSDTCERHDTSRQMPLGQLRFRKRDFDTYHDTLAIAD